VLLPKFTVISFDTDFKGHKPVDQCPGELTSQLRWESGMFSMLETSDVSIVDL